MQTIEEVCAIFQHLARLRQSVTLLNAYKGIPISSQALIVEAVDVAINVQTARRQIVCIQADQGTFIQHPYLEKTIRAYILQLDLPNPRAALTDYEIVGGDIGIRTQVRVAPTEPIKGFLKVTGLEKPYKVDLVDISMGGIGLYIEENLFNPNILHKGVPVLMILVLPGTYRQGSTGPPLTPVDQLHLPSSASLRINPLSSLQ